MGVIDFEDSVPGSRSAGTAVAEGSSSGAGLGEGTVGTLRCRAIPRAPNTRAAALALLLEAEISRITAGQAARGEVVAEQARLRRDLEALVARHRRELAEAGSRSGAARRPAFVLREATPRAERR